MEDFAAVESVPEGMPHTRVLRFSGEMSIQHGPEIKRALLDAISCADTVVVDLEGVTGIDLIGLQFICSLHRTALVQGKALSVRGASVEAVAEAVRSGGFLRATGCSQFPGTPCVWLASDHRTTGSEGAQP